TLAASLLMILTGRGIGSGGCASSSAIGAQPRMGLSEPRSSCESIVSSGGHESLLRATGAAAAAPAAFGASGTASSRRLLTIGSAQSTYGNTESGPRRQMSSATHKA